MQALRFDRFGNPDVLRIETVPDPQPDETNAVVAVRAASVNPSDVSNVAGRFPQTTLPRTPGRDYAGVVIAGPPEWLGVEVFGTGDFGFAHDGTHAERVAVPVASLRRKPATLSHTQAASLGVTFFASWIGVVEYAQLKSAETLAVIGANGGVGNAAAQIGHWLGARVIGVDRFAPEPESPGAKLFDRFVTAAGPDATAAVRDWSGGRGVDVVLNAVGGPTFEPALKMLAHRGRMALLASPGERREGFDLVDFYHNESQLFGLDTLKRDATAAALVLEALAPGFEQGALLAPQIARVEPLKRGADAYRSVAAGSPGRVVISPGQP